MYNTFVSLQEGGNLKEFKEFENDMKNGNLNSFINYFTKGKCTNTKIAWPGSGMINPLPILKEGKGGNLGRDKDLMYKTHSAVTEHYFNPMLAKNNLDMWQILNKKNSKLHPTCWYKDELLYSPNDRLYISDDGVKLKKGQPYGVTKLHYDGQLGDDEKSDVKHAENARRIQIAYVNDIGSIKLFVCPGTQIPIVRKIISKLTGASYKRGFNGFGDHPQLSNILKKYSVALPQTGLLMWRANVAHFEGHAVKQNDNSCLSNVESVLDRGLLCASRKNVNDDDLKQETRNASIFRIYCGVISIPLDEKNDVIRDMIILAYLRQKNFAMVPTSGINKKHVLFVNDKGFQSGLRIGKKDKKDDKIIGGSG